MKRHPCCCSLIASRESKDGRADGGKFYVTPTFVGNNILLYGRKSSQFPFHAMVGPDWACSAFTYALIIVPSFFFLMDVGSVGGPWIIVVGFFTFLLAIIAYSMTACSDPGIVFEYEMSSTNRNDTIRAPLRLAVNSSRGSGDGSIKDESAPVRRPIDPVPAITSYTDEESAVPAVPPELRTECSQCLILRPRGAVHCYDCGVCVEELDHHCPWTGKCVGRKNIWWFYAFLWSISVHAAFVSVTSLVFIAQGYNIFKLPGSN